MRTRIRKPCGCAALIQAIDAYIEKADKGIEDALRKAGFASPKKTVKDMSALEEELAALLEEDNRFFLNTINDFPRLQPFINEAWPELRDETDLVEKLTRTFDKTFSRTIPDYTAEYLHRVEPDADLARIGMTKQTTAWIHSWSRELSGLMKLSDNRAIQNILDDGLRKGESVQQVSERIANAGIRSYGFRARRVATTELLRAHSVAQQESFDQSPVVESKMWVHSGWREYARLNHMELGFDKDRNTVKKDDTFTLYSPEGSVYYPMYPRDSSLPPGESVNCGCIAVPVVNEDILGMSLEERNRLRNEALEELNADFDRKLDQQNSRLSLGERNADQWKNERTGNTSISRTNRIDNKIRSIVPEDVTKEYFNRATPGLGSQTIENGFSETNKEIRVMKSLHKELGGDIRILRESDVEGVKTADYLWNGKLWDVKTVEREISANTAIKRGLKQIGENPGGIILNYEDRIIDMEKLVDVINKRMGRGYNADIIVMQNDKIAKILRYHK